MFHGHSRSVKGEKMQEILLVEDDEENNALLSSMLRHYGYVVNSAHSGTEGLFYFEKNKYDLVMMSSGLAGENSEKVLNWFQLDSETPVIVLVKQELDDEAERLIIEADDFITQPYNFSEIEQRIKIQLKRKKMPKTPHVVYGEFDIDPITRTVILCGKNLSVTKQEYNILYLLFTNPKKVFTKRELYERVWENYYHGAENTINVHMSNLRNKIKRFTDKSYIETVWGVGYGACNIIN